MFLEDRHANMLVKNLDSAIFVPEGEIRNLWRKSSSTVLCAQAKEPSEIKNSPRISYYKSCKLTSLDCLLFTVYQNWQKALHPQDK